MKKLALLFSLSALGFFGFQRFTKQANISRSPAATSEINRWPQSVESDYRADLLSRLNRDKRYVSRFPASISRLEIANCTVEEAQKNLSPNEFKNLYKDHSSSAADKFKSCAKLVYKKNKQGKKFAHKGKQRNSVTGSSEIAPSPSSEIDRWNIDQENQAVSNVVATIASNPALPNTVDENLKHDIASCMVDKAKDSYNPIAFTAFSKTNDGVMGQLLSDCAQYVGLLLNNTSQQEANDNSKRLVSSVE